MTTTDSARQHQIRLGLIGDEQGLYWTNAEFHAGVQMLSAALVEVADAMAKRARAGDRVRKMAELEIQMEAAKPPDITKIVTT